MPIQATIASIIKERNVCSSVAWGRPQAKRASLLADQALPHADQLFHFPKKSIKNGRTNKKPGVLLGSSGLVSLTFRSVAAFYPAATRGLAPRMLIRLPQIDSFACKVIGTISLHLEAILTMWCVTGRKTAANMASTNSIAGDANFAGSEARTDAGRLFCIIWFCGFAFTSGSDCGEGTLVERANSLCHRQCQKTIMPCKKVWLCDVFMQQALELVISNRVR